MARNIAQHPIAKKQDTNQGEYGFFRGHGKGISVDLSIINYVKILLKSAGSKLLWQDSLTFCINMV